MPTTATGQPPFELRHLFWIPAALFVVPDATDCMLVRQRG
jgi:hypothetical protein